MEDRTGQVLRAWERSSTLHHRMEPLDLVCRGVWVPKCCSKERVTLDVGNLRSAAPRATSTHRDPVFWFDCQHAENEILSLPIDVLQTRRVYLSGHDPASQFLGIWVVIWLPTCQTEEQHDA